MCARVKDGTCLAALVRMAKPLCRAAEHQCPRTGPARPPEFPDWPMAAMTITSMATASNTTRRDGRQGVISFALFSLATQFDGTGSRNPTAGVLGAKATSVAVDEWRSTAVRGDVGFMLGEGKRWSRSTIGSKRCSNSTSTLGTGASTTTRPRYLPRSSAINCSCGTTIAKVDKMVRYNGYSISYNSRTASACLPVSSASQACTGGQAARRGSR